MEPLRVAVFRYHLPVAAALGWRSFDAAGLGVEFTVVDSSGQQRELLESGAAHAAHTSVDNVAAWHTGNHAWGVVRVIDLGLPHRLVVNPALRTVDELRGRRIAVDSARSGFVTLLRAVFERQSFGDAVEFVEVGALQQRLDALRAGAVDGCLLGAEQLQLAVDAGAHVLFALNNFFPEYPGLVVSALRPHVVLARYVAVLEACATHALDPNAADSTKDAIGRALGLDVAAADAWYRAELSRCTGLARGATQGDLLTAAWRASGRLSSVQDAPVGWYRPELLGPRAAEPAARDATAS